MYGLRILSVVRFEKCTTKFHHCILRPLKYRLKNSCPNLYDNNNKYNIFELLTAAARLSTGLNKKTIKERKKDNVA